MLTIDRLSADAHRYVFPTIDFRFQNTGHVTAFLWKFVIEAVEIKIDNDMQVNRHSDYKPTKEFDQLQESATKYSGR